jgi:hypothetical protein
LRQASSVFELPSELSGFPRETLGVGVRVQIIGRPAADVDVVLTGPVLGQRLLVVAGDDLQLDAGLGPRRLDDLGDVGGREGVAHVIVTLKPLGRPALASSALALSMSSV